MPIETIEKFTGATPEAPLPVTSTIGTGEAVSDFVKSENPLYNIAEFSARAIFDKYEADEEFLPSDNMAGYEGYAGMLGNARNASEMADMKNRIDEEQERKQSFAMADGWQKAAGIGALIASDPLTLLPVGKVAYTTYKTSGKILQGAAKTAGVAAAIETGSEVLIQANQLTRTGEESLYNVAASTLLAGMLGGAAGGFSKVEFDELAKRLDNDLTVPTESKLDSAGAMRAGTTFEQEEIAGLKKTKAVYAKMPSFAKNPVMNTAMSQSKYVRELSEKLADLSLVKNKNYDGVKSEQSVELAKKSYDQYRTSFYKSESDTWTAYKQRAIKEGLPIDQQIGSGKGGMLSRQEFNEQAWYSGINNDTHIIPEIAEFAQNSRKNVFDPILKRAGDSKLLDDIDEIDIKTADSWMKRMYDVDKIKANRIEFKQIVIDDLMEQAAKQLDETKVKSADELNDIAEQLIDRITNVTMGRLPYDAGKIGAAGGKSGARGSAKQRVWNIKDEKIKDYLVKDVRAIMESHVHTMSADIELMKKFGTLDFDVLKKQVQDDYNNLRAWTTDKKTGKKRKPTNEELAKLDKKMQRDILDLEGMWQRIRGEYAIPDNYAAPQHVLERTALGWNFVTKLGDMTASSMPDIARPIMVNGIAKSYGALFKTLRKDINGLKMSVAEMKEQGLALDIVTGMTTMRRFNVDDHMPASGKMDEITNKVSAFAGLATGINHWNAIMKTFSGIVTQNRMLNAIIDLSNGIDIPKKELVNLMSHGIDRNDARLIAEQFKKYGEQREVLKIANSKLWDNARVRDTFNNAIRKQVDETIVTPGLDKPLWMSRAGWKTVGQFKSFSFASTQRVTMAGMQQNDANFYTGMIAMTTLGSMIYAYKTKMYGGELSDDPRKWILEGVDRSGILGIAMDANNILEKVTRGTIGLNPMMGGEPMSRYASRNAAESLLGASFGMAQDVFTTTGAVFSGDVSNSDIHAARRLIPLQNAPYMRHLLDKGEEGVSSLLGVE